MKKSWLFIFSIITAFGITSYTRFQNTRNISSISPDWKTYVKTNNADEVKSHLTTDEEYQEAKIPAPALVPKKPSRAIASIDPLKGYMMRNNRVLMGDMDKKYEDQNNELVMRNKLNPKWKDQMGQDLMRFQDADTKLFVKEELPIIKIQDGKGQFLEQVIVTYLLKTGDRSSFKALVDSDTGMVVETWDRTIHEKLKKQRGGITLPSNIKSDIITK